MTISSIPPPRMLTLMRAAPASSAFSTSSLTIDAGRSTTSPAAIWAATRESNTRMGMAHTPVSEQMFAGIVYHRPAGLRGICAARRPRAMNTKPLDHWRRHAGLPEIRGELLDAPERCWVEPLLERNRRASGQLDV